MHLLKQLFQESRPFWFDDRIHNWEWDCSKSFGSPSGHVSKTILLLVPLVSDVTGFGSFYQGLIFMTAMAVIQPFSRMYLGVHSLNQVLFGLTLGLILLTAYRYVYQKALYRFFWNLLVKGKKLVKLILIVGCHVLIIVIPIIFFMVNEGERPMEKRDLDNLNRECGTSLTSLEVQQSALLSC